MNEYIITTTELFDNWFNKITSHDKARILQRLERIEKGNFGDYKWFGDIGEFRFFFGSGYRVYYTLKNNEIILLICGGDKKTQARDFKKARKILSEIETE